MHEQQIEIFNIEAAINYWREREPASGQGRVVSCRVRQLARCYGEMIYFGKSHVDRTLLSEEQQEAYDCAAKALGLE